MIPYEVGTARMYSSAMLFSLLVIRYMYITYYPLSKLLIAHSNWNLIHKIFENDSFL